MIDRLFTLTLTLAILVGSTLAIGADFYSPRHGAERSSSVTVLPRVVITGRISSDSKVAQAQLPSSAQSN